MTTVNFTKPVTSDLRADVLTYIRDYMAGQAKMFDGDTLVSPPTNLIRYNVASKRFEKWNSATWDNVDLGGALHSSLAVTAQIDAATLRLSGVDDVSPVSTAHPFQIGPSAGANIAIDTNEIMARTNGVATPLYLNNEGGGVVIGGALTLKPASGTSLADIYPAAATDGYIYISRDAGKTIGFALRTGTAWRWSFGVSPTAESGANAGSNFYFNRYDDAGTYIDQPFTINRATGAITASAGLGLITADISNFYGEAVPFAIQKNGNFTVTMGLGNNTAGTAAIVRTHFVTGTANSFYSNQLIDGNGTPVHRQSYGSAVASAEWMFNGVNKFKISNVGNIYTGGEALEIGELGSGNRYAYIDFHGDNTYTDFSLRVIRYNAGANADSEIVHRGTGTLIINAAEAAPIVFKTSNTERARLDSAGNLSVGGFAPSAWPSGYRALELGRVGNGIFASTSGSQTLITANAYWNGTNWKYANTAVASNLELSGAGYLYFYYAASGTAGNNITWTTQLVVDPSGNLTATGNVTAYSDVRWKRNIKSRVLSLDEMLSIDPIAYSMKGRGKRDTGVSAQQLRPVLPEAVLADDEGRLSVDYGRAAMVMALSLAREVKQLKEERQ